MKTKFICTMVILTLLICRPIKASAKTEYDFTKSSNVSSETLKNALYHDLRWYAYVFIDCEEEYGINAIMLSSIAALESGWGKSNVAKDKNNLFGWKNDDGEYMKFKSKKECIQYVAQAISEKYIDEDGKYYSGGTTIEHIARLYCDQPEWEKEVNGIIFDIMRRIEHED